MSSDQAERLDTGRPFTRSDALEAGLNPRILRGSRFRRIFRGVYIDDRVPDSAQLRVQAALACFDETAFASHASAARIYGVPMPTLPTEHVTVCKPDLRRRRSGVKCHLDPAADVQELKGVRVSAPAQMFVELATLLNLVDLVVVGDNLVRNRYLTSMALVDHCSSSTRAGALAARRAAVHVRDRVDSPMESRLRMLIVLAGLPEPGVNLTIRDVNGDPIRRYDLSWPSVKVIVEYDGRHHIEREEQWETDLERRESIDDDEWRILVVIAGGIYKDPGKTVLRVWRLLRSRGLPGVPNRPSDAWRPYFPGRA